MNNTTGTIVGVNGNMITVKFTDPVGQNEVGFAMLDELRLMSEIVRVRGDLADMQVFEDTTGITVGDTVEFTGELLSVELGPGLLTQVYDGLQNPLPRLAEECGFFLQRGRYIESLPRDQTWDFTPRAEPGSTVSAGETLGVTPEGIFEHCIMVPFNLTGTYTVDSVADAGTYRIEDVIARLRDEKGGMHEVSMLQRWPVKIPIQAYAERLRP